jgi:hypothetical protein
MKNTVSSSLFTLLLTSQLHSIHCQPEWVKPVNYTYDEPVVFNQWCEEVREVFGPSCTCVTNYGDQNNIYSVDLDHEINCDPLQGESTCIEGISIDSARVWLKATSIGYENDFARIKETAIRDFYIFMDETDIGTISFRFNDNINQRRTGCEAIYGAINCNLCGICDAPPNNKSAEVPTHLGPADIFRGISGQCRYGNNGPNVPQINLFNTCENGPNVLTKLFWEELEIRSANETGRCPTPAPTEPPLVKSSATTPRVVISLLGLTLASFLLTSVLV